MTSSPKHLLTITIRCERAGWNQYKPTGIFNNTIQVYRYFFNPIGDDIFASELSYVLGEPLQGLGRNQGGTESELSKRMIKLWSDFSRSDSPSPEEEEWPVFESPAWEYLKLEDERLTTGRDMRGRVCEFWEK